MEHEGVYVYVEFLVFLKTKYTLIKHINTKSQNVRYGYLHIKHIYIYIYIGTELHQDIQSDAYQAEFLKPVYSISIFTLNTIS